LNRLWLIGGVLILALAGVIGWLNASTEGQLQTALMLADVTTAGCDGAGQVHLRIGNAADRPMLKVSGVLSVVGSSAEPMVPMGNFEVTAPIAPGQKVDACVASDETGIAGRDRKALEWLARATAIEFGDARR